MLVAPLIVIFSAFSLQVVLSFGDDKGRAAGKVRLIVKLSNAAINEYDQSHYGDDVLGMDGVSVNAGESSHIVHALSAVRVCLCPCSLLT